MNHGVQIFWMGLSCLEHNFSALTLLEDQLDLRITLTRLGE
jgi:hypothetical protein